MEALPIFLLCLHALFTCTMAVDTMAVNQMIKDGQTILSPQQTFELGFFSPSNKNQNRYIGIWYKRQGAGTVIWVANRETPIANKSGELTLLPGGVLVLRDSTTNGIIWSSDSSRTTGNSNPVAQLLDSGNLMVIDGQDGAKNYIWQSFDHPTDTFMPGMKFGRDLERGVVRNFTSWKSDDDPSKGEYLSYMDFNGLPQIFQKKGDVFQYRLGSWNGLGQTGNPIYTNPIYTHKQVSNEREIYLEYDLINNSTLCRLRSTPTGEFNQYNWINRTQGWFLYWTPNVDSCTRYGLCGVYGSCDILQSPACGCLKGFIPKRQDQWDAADWTSGCRREIPLDCGVGEGFRKYSYVKLPDTRQSWFDTNMTPEQCEVKCRNECNCTAYTTLDIKYDTGCLLWYDELMDIRTFPDRGQDIYIRVAAKELEKDNRISGSKRRVSIIIISFIVASLSSLLGLCLFNIRKRYLKAKGRRGSIAWKNDQDLPLYSLSMLLDATDNFSDNNKLGQGGFGPVYKGFLDGQEVAVKRLSKSSTQGVEEFKNEVIFISKLRHRNLVKILGCCTEEQEQMLVYEYMPNKGLDLLLFDESNRKILDWTHRFNIINGIARGLLYLHEDSPVRIIHRDLKAANILLDHDMNPKISDFGLARSFGGNETETNTNRVVGTYGYMSPEYAGRGLFSIKSDVFSFGVLVLEIVSGKKNRSFIHRAHSQNLLGHAWRLYKKGKTLKLADAFLIKSDQTFEVLRSIHVGLLCVQHRPDDRPNMSKVVMMLSSDGQLSEPKQPGFYIEDTQFKLSSMETQNSNKDVTISLLEPR